MLVYGVSRFNIPPLMIILSAQISNYKSFLRSAEIPLKPGFNVVVGQNHSGKTAFLEALSFAYTNKPHLSLKTKSARGITVDPYSAITLKILLSPEEVYGMLAEANPLFYPVTDGQRSDPRGAVANFAAVIRNPIEIELTWDPGRGFTSVRVPGIEQTLRGSNTVVGATFDMSERTLTYVSAGGLQSADWTLTIPSRIATFIQTRMYLFKAERLNVGEHMVGSETNLNSDARNLAQVLNLLKSSHTGRWERYVAAVRAVLPQINDISVPPVQQIARILIWSFFSEGASERDDLAVTLADSGTGIGQVLAILYVVLTAEHPRTIIIDEPQSFLHPGAVRKLFDILRRHPEHQYVISTHSAAAIAAAKPNTLLLARMEKGETVIESLDPGETTHLSRMLMELGARLSDVFGADSILWVEGRTEEECFPIIMENAKLTNAATNVLGVNSTGAFGKKTATEAFRLYRRLSETRSLVPPALGFIFDRETRSAKEIEDLIRESGGRVQFTSRRMYENYLLNPNAIWAVIHADVPAITLDAVAKWIEKNKWRDAFFGASVPLGERTDDFWANKVHGADFLTSLFSELSENTVSYDKVDHGKKLTKWLCDNRSAELGEFVKMIDSLNATKP
jgi:energy-coupling factor transporter ATP-binding protein EcfA2